MEKVKTVLVTGGTGDIGEAICKAFSEAGYFVVINYYKSEKKALALCKSLKNSDVFYADVSDKKQVEAMIKAYPDIDVLVNNAGVSFCGVFDNVPGDMAMRMYEVNLFGTLNTSRAVLPGMINKKSGVIINISSVWGEIGASCEVDYSASKAAIIGFTKALAKEVGPSQIRVNCICPGIIDTKMNDHLSVAEIEDIIDTIPLERLGRPEDIAETVLFLAGEKAGYISGAVLSVNGGLN